MQELDLQKIKGQVTEVQFHTKDNARNLDSILVHGCIGSRGIVVDQVFHMAFQKCYGCRNKHQHSNLDNKYLR